MNLKNAQNLSLLRYFELVIQNDKEKQCFYIKMDQSKNAKLKKNKSREK